MIKIVGLNMKRLREEKGLKLREFARQLGVSASFVSQMEKGKASPSLSTLKNIADKLSTTVGDLIGEGQKLTDSPVTREEERINLQNLGKGVSVYLLTSQDSNKQMQPLLFKLGKNANSGESKYNHFGQEFVTVIKGAMELKLNDSLFILKKGDSIYFNSKIPHSFRNIAEGETEAIWVITPPSF